MNFQTDNYSFPMRVMIINPLSEAGVMLCVKSMRGVLFGHYQLVNVILLVYANEIEQGQSLKFQLQSCGFPCVNSITVSSDLPRLSDADLFIFITEFPSLNCMDFSKIDDDAVFDSLYLLLKIANNLEMAPPPEKPEIEPLANIRKNVRTNQKEWRPIIIADGLVALDILKTFSKNLPNDIFFSGTPVFSMAQTVLADKLGVSCEDLNRVYVWAADDNTFHVDVARPLYNKEKHKERKHCEWDVLADREFEEFEIDFTQFNEAWLKKDFLRKLATLMENQPIGNIYKAAKLCQVVRAAWICRSDDLDSKIFKANLGVISDGSLGTYKGLPYFLPLIFEGNAYKVDNYLEEDFHLKQEIKRINKAVLAHHRKLIPYCQKFLEKNVLKLEFLPRSEEASSHDFTLPTVSTE